MINEDSCAFCESISHFPHKGLDLHKNKRLLWIWYFWRRIQGTQGPTFPKLVCSFCTENLSWGPHLLQRRLFMLCTEGFRGTLTNHNFLIELLFHTHNEVLANKLVARLPASTEPTSCESFTRVWRMQGTGCGDKK